MKTNLILHTTTFCNYNCSYCDVIKDKQQLSKQILESILIFIKNNSQNINRFKFFGGEPLLAWNNIKYIINKTNLQIGNNYEIVTNTTLLTDEIGEYFKKYFSIIFFSIDTENNFDYEKIEKFIKQYDLENKIYFNLVINPGEEFQSLEQFYKLYNLGFKGFNILPVYFTKNWTKQNLGNLSKVMKSILDLKLKNDDLRLFGFQSIKGEESKLTNNSFFINTDGKIYYSDIVSNFFGEKLKKELFIGNIEDINLKKIENKKFEKEKKVIRKLEEYIYTKVKGQKELEKIMDYFSKYLNNKNVK